MPEINRFNLVEEPWIPIVGVGQVSLRELFTRTDYLEIGGNPIQKIALMKLILAIAQAAYTPNDDVDWQSLGSERMADRCVKYLDKWSEAFWLYGERPFLQMPAIKKAEKKNFSAVFPEVASGNTTVLTQYQMEKSLTDADKALLVISLMGFGLGGKKTDNTVCLSEGYLKKPTGKPGAHLGYLGYLHSFLVGKNLMETIWLNLLTKELIEKIGFSGLCLPPWEQMPAGEICCVAEALKASFMGRLVPLSRFCLLAEDGIHYSEGISHQTHKEGKIDPTITVDNKVNKAVWVDPTKRPWRWLTALLGFISQTNQQTWDCAQVRHGLTRARKESYSIGVWSGGLKVSSNAGEQYVSGSDDFVESKIILPSDWLGENWFSNLKLEMELLELLSKGLYASICGYFKTQNADGSKQAVVSVNLFWQMCEKKFQQLLDVCAEETTEARQPLRRVFFEIVQKVYNTTCSMETARQLDAWAKCRPKPGKYLNKIHKETI